MLAGGGSIFVLTVLLLRDGVSDTSWEVLSQSQLHPCPSGDPSPHRC